MVDRQIHKGMFYKKEKALVTMLGVALVTKAK